MVAKFISAKCHKSRDLVFRDRVGSRYFAATTSGVGAWFSLLEACVNNGKGA